VCASFLVAVISTAAVSGDIDKSAIMIFYSVDSAVLKFSYFCTKLPRSRKKQM